MEIVCSLGRLFTDILDILRVNMSCVSSGTLPKPSFMLFYLSIEKSRKPPKILKIAYYIVLSVRLFIKRSRNYELSVSGHMINLKLIFIE